MNRGRRRPVRKPGNALAKAEDLVKQGSNEQALEELHGFLRDSGLRRLPHSKEHRDLMLLFCKLCVNLEKTAVLKDGMYFYRIYTADPTPDALRAICVRCATYAIEVARAKRDEFGLVSQEAMEDLDEAQAPDDLLLASVAADTEERRTKEAVLPWVRVAWDTLRHLLDHLRIAFKVQDTYHELVAMAASFVQEFQLNSELVKLCRMVRNHLDKRPATDRDNKPIEFKHEERLMHVRTRFVQVRAACELGIFNEAFTTIEDGHELMLAAEERIPAPIRAEFCALLARVLRASGQALFAASALLARYRLLKLKTDMTAEDRAVEADRLVVAILACPVFSADGFALGSFGSQAASLQHRSRMSHLMALAELRSLPSRSVLVSDMIAEGALAAASESTRTLFKRLETSTAARQMPARCAEAIAASGEQDAVVAGYVPDLKQVVLANTVRLLGKVYSSIRLSTLQRLLAPLGLSDHAIERSLIKAIHGRFLQVRIDHRSGCVRVAEPSLDHADMQLQLARLGTSLRQNAARHAALSELASQTPGLEDEDEARRAAVFATARRTLSKAHHKMQARSAFIEAVRQKKDEYRAEAREAYKARRLEERARAEEARIQREKQIEADKEKERERKEKEAKLAAEAAALRAQLKASGQATTSFAQRIAAEQAAKEASKSAAAAAIAAATGGTTAAAGGGGRGLALAQGGAVTEEKVEELRRQRREKAQRERRAKAQRVAKMTRKLDYRTRYFREFESDHAEVRATTMEADSAETHRERSRKLLERHRQQWEARRGMADRFRAALPLLAGAQETAVAARAEAIAARLPGITERARAVWMEAKRARARERYFEQEREKVAAEQAEEERRAEIRRRALELSQSYQSGRANDAHMQRLEQQQQAAGGADSGNWGRGGSAAPATGAYQPPTGGGGGAYQPPTGGGGAYQPPIGRPTASAPAPAPAPAPSGGGSMWRR